MMVRYKLSRLAACGTFPDSSPARLHSRGKGGQRYPLSIRPMWQNCSNDLRQAEAVLTHGLGSWLTRPHQTVDLSADLLAD